MGFIGDLFFRNLDFLAAMGFIGELFLQHLDLLGVNKPN